MRMQAAAAPRLARDPARLVAASFALVAGALALISDGFRWQDEYAHLQFSRWLWTHPDLALDVWGRPLATIVYAVPALLGVWAARLVTVALAVLAASWTGKAARARGSAGTAATLLVVAQPVFFAFSFGALPGTLFAALLARFFLEDSRGRVRVAALVAALLPLARVEGALVVAVYMLVLWRRGERRAALLPCLGLVAWNAAGWAATGEWLFLLTANPYPAVGSIYPRGGWLFLGKVLPVATGAVVFLLAQAGAVRRAGLPHAIAAVAGVFLVLVWGVPLFASAPTPVYLIGFSPVLALLAAEGWRAVRSDPRLCAWLGLAGMIEAVLVVPRRSLGSLAVLAAPVGHGERLALVAGFAVAAGVLVLGARRPRVLAGGLVLAAAVAAVPATRPVSAGAHERVAARAAAWLEANARDRTVGVVAPDVAWMARIDQFTGRSLRSLPSGALAVWDSRYAAERGIPVDAFAGWHERARFAEGAELAIIFERR